MGRVKLEIKKLENSSSRQTTYSKRKNGILKKAHELSVLCDIDLALVMFSPGGKPSFCFGKHGIEEVIAKFNQIPPQERTKRKLEVLEALKKMFKKLDHDVDTQDFFGTSTPTIKDLTDQAARIQTRFVQIDERLRYWTNPDTVNDLELLMQMEESLEKSLEHIHRQKENFQKRQHVSLEYSNELQFRVGDEQQFPQLWAPSDDVQHLFLTQDPKLPAQREMDSCTGSTSGSYFGCLSMSSKSETNSPGQLSGIDNIGQDAFQGQFSGQYPYLPHGLHMQGDKNILQAVGGMDQRQSSVCYNVGRNNQPTVPWNYISNHLPPMPADSAFGDYFNYQKQPTVPAPATTSTSMYERIARDPSHLMFDNALNPFG